MPESVKRGHVKLPKKTNNQLVVDLSCLHKFVIVFVYLYLNRILVLEGIYLVSDV